MTSAGGYNPYGGAAHPPYPPFPPGGPPPPRRGLSPIAWVLLVLGLGVFLCCAGFLGFAAYVGSVGPGTQIYVANEVPKKYVDLANELKLLDSGETIRFFYSDAITDVRNGMYFVTDKKVVVYKADAATPSTVVPFTKITDADLESSTSWAEDGSITLHLLDGSVVVFPVSGEGKRDKLMFDAIRFTPRGGKSQPAADTAVER